jgi:hypothetical protein
LANNRKKHSLRYFFAIIGTLVLSWKVVTGFHDMNISYEGSRCVGEYLGSGFYEHWAQDRKWKKKNRWNEAAISYIKKYVAPNKQAQTLESLQQHCSKYIEVWKTFTSNINGGPAIRDDIIIVKNWGRSGYHLFMQELHPAISDKRFKSMFFWAAFVLFCIVDLRRLNKIFIWSGDD